ncbi:MAG: rhomboid family intramembrane serine protease [Halopseudomonas sp.]
MVESLKARLQISASMLSLIWVIFLIEAIIPGLELRSWGILPRDPSGLFPGVIAAPLLHGGLWHLVANSIPLFVLSFLVSLHGTGRLIRVSIAVTLLGGLLVWVFGRNAYHIGASGLIFGLWAYLLAYGYVKCDLKAIAIAIAVLVLYGGMAFGLLLGTPGVSIESHLFGALIGALCAVKDGRSKK